jgi:hypothetical protein
MNRAFKRWFGKSVAVDSSGKPLVMYHGTNREFESFTQPYIWSSEGILLASEYADARHEQEGGAAQVLPLYVRAERPMDADELPRGVTATQFFNHVTTTAPIGQKAVMQKKQAFLDLLRRIKKGMREEGAGPTLSRHEYWLDAYAYLGADGADAIKELLQLAGFDSIKMTEAGQLTYGVFTPTQVKSIYNVGTWSDQDTRIQHNPRQGRTMKLNYEDLDGDDVTLNVKYVGKGMFTKAYLKEGKKPLVYLVTDDSRSGDYSKTILAEMDRDGIRSKHLPKVKHVGYTSDASVFTMPLYNAPLRKADSAKAWEQYRLLKACVDALSYHRDYRGVYDGYKQREAIIACSKTGKALGKLLKKGKASSALIRAVQELSDAANNYGSDYAFEVSPRNLATDDKGNLILLDILFPREAAQMKKWKRV